MRTKSAGEYYEDCRRNGSLGRCVERLEEWLAMEEDPGQACAAMAALGKELIEGAVNE